MLWWVRPKSEPSFSPTKAKMSPLQMLNCDFENILTHTRKSEAKPKGRDFPAALGNLLPIFYDMITLFSNKVGMCRCMFLYLSFFLCIFFSPFSCAVKHYVSYSPMKNKPRNPWQLRCSLYSVRKRKVIWNVRKSNWLYFRINPLTSCFRGGLSATFHGIGCKWQQEVRELFKFIKLRHHETRHQ